MLKVVYNRGDIPFDVLADIIHEFNLIYDDVVWEISQDCIAEDYPQYGSNFELRLAAYDSYFDELWLRLCADHGYIIVSDDDDI